MLAFLQSSPTASPASARFKIEKICCSLNFDFFTRPPCQLLHHAARELTLPSVYISGELTQVRLGVSKLKRLRELEAENARLKKMYADRALENEAIRAVLNQKP